GAFEVADEFGELVEAGGGFEPFGVFDGGRAGHELAGSDVSSDPGLGGEDDVLADPGGAGEADLRTEEGILADGAAVANLDQVVDLCPGSDAGLSDGGAVDGGVGLDL